MNKEHADTSKSAHVPPLGKVLVVSFWPLRTFESQNQMAVQRRQSQRQRSANGRSRTSVTGPAQFDGSCGICGRRCESKFALTFHVAHCRGQLFARPNTARVRCPWPGCSNRTAYTESRLAGHIRCHTGERPFLCVTHGSRIHRRFATKSNALAHVRTHHGKGDGPVLREVAVVKNVRAPSLLFKLVLAGRFVSRVYRRWRG